MREVRNLYTDLENGEVLRELKHGERRQATGLKRVGKVPHVRQWFLYLLHLEAS